MNFIENPEALLRKNQSRTISSSATPLINEPVTPAPSTTTAMAQKSLHEYFIHVVANVPIRPAVNMSNTNFQLKTGLIMMV